MLVKYSTPDWSIPQKESQGYKGTRLRWYLRSLRSLKTLRLSATYRLVQWIGIPELQLKPNNYITPRVLFSAYLLFFFIIRKRIPFPPFFLLYISPPQVAESALESVVYL